MAVLYLSNYFMSLISTIGIIPGNQPPAQAADSGAPSHVLIRPCLCAVAYLERQSYLREHASKMYSVSTKTTHTISESLLPPPR